MNQICKITSALLITLIPCHGMESQPEQPRGAIGMFKGLVGYVYPSAFNSYESITVNSLAESEVRQLFAEPLAVSGAMLKSTSLDQASPWRALQIQDPQTLLKREVELVINQSRYMFQIEGYTLGYHHHGWDWVKTNTDKALLLIVSYMVCNAVLPTSLQTIVTLMVVAALVVKYGPENFAELRSVWDQPQDNLSLAAVGNFLGVGTRLSEDMQRHKQQLKLYYKEGLTITGSLHIKEPFSLYKTLNLQLKCLGKISV